MLTLGLGGIVAFMFSQTPTIGWLAIALGVASWAVARPTVTQSESGRRDADAAKGGATTQAR